MAHAITAHDDHHDQPPKGYKRWLFATNHKDIGTMYLVFALVMFFIGGFMAMLIRAELFQPGLQLMQPEFFNMMTTNHALVMIFGAIMPAFVGLANWMVPLQVGAPDMALPRMNNLSFWILPFAFSLLLGTIFVPGGMPAGGWTMYPPLILQTGAAFPMLIFAIHLMGASSIMGAINIIVTILNMRTPKMTLLKMPPFSSTSLITAYLLIAVMPVLAGAVTMLLTDHFFGTSFFNAAGGGDPIMFEHIFWFFGHPEVYIMILPAFGLISELLHPFSRQPLFGATSMIYSVASIAFLSFIVWGHNMFADGMPMAAQLFFMMSTMLIAVPTGVKGVQLDRDDVARFAVVRAAADAVRDRLPVHVLDRRVLRADARHFGRLSSTRTPTLSYAFPLRAGARGDFSESGCNLLLAARRTGVMYSMTLAKWHFWLSTIFVNVLFFPQHFLGLAGMPRRIPDYAVQFSDWNMVSSLGGFGFGLSQILFAVLIIKSMRGEGKKASAAVWDGAMQHGLEWTLSSPPPFHTFTTPPDLPEQVHL